MALPKPVRLATRGSALAMTQSQQVADFLERESGSWFELVEIKTEGDVNLRPLEQIGGTGVFVVAVREAVRSARADIAVHSLKDLPTAAAEGISIAAIPTREDPRDVLCARDGLTFSDLPQGATVGTGSPRRAAQLRLLRPDLNIVGIRGNVDTRLAKVTSGELDAVVLAAAGLHRLGRQAHITHYFEPSELLPAPGQGALAVEARAVDLARDSADNEAQPAQALIVKALRSLNDPRTHIAVMAERALLAGLEAGCSAPVGAYASYEEREEGPMLVLDAIVVDPATSAAIRGRGELDASAFAKDAHDVHTGAIATLNAMIAEANLLGRSVAGDMLEQGAAGFLQ
ncbi:hydroxymethylbilane synthase [Micrococcales bacterium 31B]|nr:hydroxymethylbilane synthase [Micrococcales bacterium 31B]